MVDLWLELVSTFWILIPAYAANGFPPFARGKRPIDFGKRLADGHRIFGNGKTIEGFVLGMAAGIFYAGVLSWLAPTLNAYAAIWGVTLPRMSLFIGFMIALGALIGDLAGSFIKRRLGLARGTSVLFLDQLNFVVGALLFAYAFTQITLWMVVIALIITPALHRLVCMIGYALGLKGVPW
jgi:CDP-2,3-bis-(O-geranylgeranyl)-sn-glycerol synthase